MSLFRKEAVSHQSERLVGAITLAQPLSIKFVVSVLVLIASAIIIFLFNAEYSRKETVRGFLSPNKGVIKSYANQGGTIEKILVKEGQQVSKDQPLAVLFVQQSNAQGIKLSDQLVAKLEQQLVLIKEEMTQHEQLQVQETQNLKDNKQAKRKERWALKSQYKLANQKLKLLEENQAQLLKLNKSGYVSTNEQKRQQQSVIDTKQEKQNLARLLLQNENELNQINFGLKNIPQQYTLRVNDLKRKKAEIETQLAQVKNNYKYTVTASTDGVITGIQAVEGETLSSSVAAIKPLMHILPKGSELVAELLLPTRSAGFVQIGDDTRLRFDAFPYQRFGFIASEITRIDRALITPNEVQLPVALQEPVYRLKAKLDEQQIKAYGKSFALKSGMLFEADIMLEQRSLIQWLLEPIYSLNGRVG